MKTKELDFYGCGKPQPLQMSWMCWANRLLSRTLEQMSCCVLCQVAGSDRVMSVECNVWCCRIDVHTVWISGIFFSLLLNYFQAGCMDSMPVCVETCCLHSWFHILWFSSLQKESCSSTPGLLHDMQSVGTIKKFVLHMHCWLH